MRLGTGVVNPYTRGPAVLAMQAAALADASGGRFVLGLGASSNVIVERWNEVPFEKPLTRLRATIPVLREVLSGGRGPGGFRLETAPEHPVPIVLAALRDRMLRLGGELADGTFTNFLPLSATEHVVARVREGEAGREPTEVICRFFCIPGDGMDTARFMFAAYATVPVYEAFFRGLGWGDAIEEMVAAWRGGHRKAALEAVPEELVREIFVFGSPDDMRARLNEYAARGITTFVLAPIAPPEQLPAMIDSLAP
jgi:alkanesulfonate monooxygenase SsuD/methylene tetrahydromethanopterin reductase-like flavin-dependent oxidoreductase (luciferase family)